VSEVAIGAIGIDLGTTNSVVASIDVIGRPVVVRNGAGEETTPSAVYFNSDSSVLVGESARVGWATDPDNGVVLVKRHMGEEFPILIRDKYHSPESISAIILKYLTEGLPPGTPTVVTVPAYFGIAEREATQQAAMIAGLDILELVSEPVAAAAHYGLSSAENARVLVYDLGGGTCDTTVLRVGGGDTRVIAVEGDSKLGGADIDQRLLSVVLERFGATSLLAVDELVEDEVAMGALLLDVERAKKQLSARTEAIVNLRWQGTTISAALSRTDLVTGCADLLATSFAIVERLLTRVRVMGVSVIDHVILVGGSSRLPTVSEHLERLTGKTPQLLEPDLAVAKGAALRGYQLTRQHRTMLGTEVASPSTAPSGLTKSLQGEIRSTVSRGFGVLISDSFDPQGGEIIHHVVHANEQLPVSRSTTSFGTILDNQEAVRVQIFEQAGSVESDRVGDNRRVLDGEVSGIPPLPAGSAIRLDFDVALDGRLSVTVTEPTSGKSLTLEAYVEGVIDGPEAARLTDLVRALKIAD